MNPTTYALPDTHEPTGTNTPAASWVDGAWAQIDGRFHAVPPIAWVGAISALTIASIALIPFLRGAANRAGKRQGRVVTEEDKRDRRLLLAAMIPASLFWLAVLVGSGRGLIAFGRDDLHWEDGWEYLVPLTLDGVAIAFALLAFRAVKKKLNPDRAVRIAGAAMVASAGINFLHEVGGSKLGAAYLAILSLLGMLIFDELLSQFEQGAETEVGRKNPKFGLRWATWPTNTACAWVAWRNHPDETLKATVSNAITHLETVRSKKRIKRAERIGNPAWWWRFAPWAHIGTLETLVSEHRSALEVERTAARSGAADIERLMGEHDTQMRELQKAHRSELAKVRSDNTEQLDKLRSEHAEQTETLKAELAGKLLRIQNAPTRSAAPASKNVPEQTRSAPVRMSDREALAAMFAEHPEPDYAWADREVNRITGAGFSSRAPRLTGAAVKHLTECPEQSHKTCYTERSESGSDDTKERAS